MENFTAHVANSTIEKINNNPLQFSCPKCGSHELVLVEAHIVHYTVAKINESGELEYQPTPFYVENDGNREDCYFACAGYSPGYPDGHGHGNCDFIPNDPDNRISDDYTMLQWIKDHQQTPAAE